MLWRRRVSQSRQSNEASNELGALLADEGPVDEDRVEALLRSAVLPDSAVGVFIEVPPVGP